MTRHRTLEHWRQTNPAYPGFPTLHDDRDWKAISRRCEELPHRMTYVLAGRPLIGRTFEETPWGGVERAKLAGPEGSVICDAFQLTVLPPEEGAALRPRGSGGQFRRNVALTLRRRITVDPTLFRGDQPRPGSAEAPPERRRVAPSEDQVARAQWVRRIGLEWLRYRFIAGGVGGISAEVWLTGTAFDLGMLGAGVLGGVIGAAAPTVAAKAGRRRSRSFVTHAGDPRLHIAQVLQYYLAHRDLIGERAESLIGLTWKSLYHVAEADLTTPAVLAEVTARAHELEWQADATAADMEEQARLDEAVARPRVQAIEQQENEDAVAGLAEAPTVEEIADLTREIELDTQAKAGTLDKLTREDDAQ